MPVKSKRAFRFFKVLENNPALRKEKDISLKTAKEMTKANTGKKSYKNLPEKK